MIENKEGNSQFLEGCNTDWNLNHEFILWLNYWFKEFKKKASIDLKFHKFEYKGKEMTQGEIIEKVIKLTDIDNREIIWYIKNGSEKSLEKSIIDSKSL